MHRGAGAVEVALPILDSAGLISKRGGRLVQLLRTPRHQLGHAPGRRAAACRQLGHRTRVPGKSKHCGRLSLDGIRIAPVQLLHRKHAALDAAQERLQRIHHARRPTLQFLLAGPLLVPHGLLHRLHRLLRLLLRLLGTLHLISLSPLRGLLELPGQSALLGLACGLAHGLGGTGLRGAVLIKPLRLFTQIVRQRACLGRGLALRLGGSVELGAGLVIQLFPCSPDRSLPDRLGLSRRIGDAFGQPIDSAGEFGRLPVATERRLKIRERRLRAAGALRRIFKRRSVARRIRRCQPIGGGLCLLRGGAGGARCLRHRLAQAIGFDAIAFQAFGKFPEGALERRHPLGHPRLGTGKATALRRGCVVTSPGVGSARCGFIPGRRLPCQSLHRVRDAGLLLPEPSRGIPHLPEARSHLLRKLGRRDDPKDPGRTGHGRPGAGGVAEGIHRPRHAHHAIARLCPDPGDVHHHLDARARTGRARHRIHGPHHLASPGNRDLDP